MQYCAVRARFIVNFMSTCNFVIIYTPHISAVQRNSTDNNNNGSVTIIVAPRVVRSVSCMLRHVAMPPFFKLMTLQIPGVSGSDVLSTHLFKQADTQIQTSPCVCIQLSIKHPVVLSSLVAGPRPAVVTAYQYTSYRLPFRSRFQRCLSIN